MRIGEVAQRAGVTTKTVRYYESLGLISPSRTRSGYREFSEQDARAVEEIRQLSGLGIPLSRVSPFLECLRAGHEHGDECPASLAAYGASVAELDAAIAALVLRRAALLERIDVGVSRSFGRSRPNPPPHDPTLLPANLPVPIDDGGADHLPGLAVPPIVLPSTSGRRIDVSRVSAAGRAILYCYPLTGRPGVDVPEGWNDIPGARGCTPEACGFRDHYSELRDAGAHAVYGVSSQSSSYQRELADRLRLPFEMLSDVDWSLADALRLPTFAAPGVGRLYSRLTLVLRHGSIEHVFYPVFPPDEHAAQVLAWLRRHPDD